MFNLEETLADPREEEKEMQVFLPCFGAVSGSSCILPPLPLPQVPAPVTLLPHLSLQPQGWLASLLFILRTMNFETMNLNFRTLPSGAFAEQEGRGSGSRRTEMRNLGQT